MQDNNSLTTLPKEGSADLTLTRLPLDQYLQAVRPRGISDVFKSQAGQISRIIHERGAVEVKAMLVDQIISLCKFFNFSRTMDIQQVSETADLIIDQFPIYTPEDFVLCFKNIKVLKYGKFFEGIDGAKILEMLRAYDLERDEQIFAYRQKEANQFKQDLRVMPEVIAEAAKGILEKSQIAKEQSYTQDPSDPVQKYLKDFDSLYNTQSPTGTGVRFVEYQGKRMDSFQYCTTRYNEEHA